MKNDNKYNVILGVMIFLFILLVGAVLAFGLYFIANNEKDDVQEKQQDESLNVELDKKEEVSSLEKATLEGYVEKIYKYGEIVNIPTFENINNADEEWLWVIAFKECENTEMVTKSELVAKAKELFGTSFNKQPKEDSVFGADWNEEMQYYEGKAHGLMAEDETRYIVKSVEKDQNRFKVEIVEYVLNVSEIIKGEENAKVQIKNGDTVVATVSENEDKEYVKENSEMFTSRILEIEETNGKLHIVSCKNK